MSITYSEPTRVGTKSNQRDRVMGWVAAVLLAGLVVALVAGFFEPFSDEQLQQMHFEQTEGLPQDR